MRVRVEEELRLDAFDAGGVDEELDEVVEEADFDFGRGVGAAAGDGEGVADDRLVFFVDTEDVAGDAAVFDGDVAGEDAGVEVLEEQIGGGAVVPAQAFVPELDFGVEDGLQRVRREVAKVEDLELECRRHAMPKCAGANAVRERPPRPTPRAIVLTQKTHRVAERYPKFVMQAFSWGKNLRNLWFHITLTLPLLRCGAAEAVPFTKNLCIFLASYPFWFGPIQNRQSAPVLDR